MSDQQSRNFFTDELNRYYVEHGRAMPEEVMEVLNRNIMVLSSKEKELLVKFVIPRREQIKQALRSSYLHSSANKFVWQKHLVTHAQTIIGQMVAEVMIESEVPMGDSSKLKSREPKAKTGSQEELTMAGEGTAKLETGGNTAHLPSAQEQTAGEKFPLVRVSSWGDPSTLRISTKPPSHLFPEEPVLESPERLYRRRSRKKTALLMGTGFLLGVAILMLVIGLVVQSKEAGKEQVYTGKEHLFPLEIASPQANQVFNTSKITVSGRTEPDSEVVVRVENTGAETTCRSGGDGDFSVEVILEEGKNLIKVTSRKGEVSVDCSVSCQYEMDFATYKSLCRKIDFDLLNLDPEAYKGQKYTATGGVVLVEEKEGLTTISLNVTRGKYGLWYDTIYVTYKGSISIGKNSVITVYGEVKGGYSTVSFSGRPVVLPWVEARFIEVVKA